MPNLRLDRYEPSGVLVIQTDHFEALETKQTWQKSENESILVESFLYSAGKKLFLFRRLGRRFQHFNTRH